MYWYILVFTSFTFFNSCVEGLGCVQDTIVVVPPYSYSIADDIADVPFGDCWYARPQLLYTVTLCGFVEVCTCTYLYIRVCTGMYLE